MLKNLIETIKPKPKLKFSLENLQYLCSTLVRNPVITDQNNSLIVETLRQIAEVMIWGDQHNSEFFDFFLEKNLLGFFLKILSQKTKREVKVQLIQTLSILIENIRSQNSIYYLLSNNHINELITHKFDFSDDELMAYYISLLKTLSLKLNPNTIQFFFNSIENDFPLYTEAIKFFNHRDSMIRIAVRTLTLNVYKVEDQAMRQYVLDRTAVPYFSNIVWFIRDQCFSLDQLHHNSTHANKAKLEDFTAELMDYFYYLQDIFNLGIKELSEVLSDQLIKYLILPQFVGSLIPDDDVVLEDRLSPLLAVFLLSQIFYIFSFQPLVNTIAAALVHPNPSSYSFPHLQRPISQLETRRMPKTRYSLSDLHKLEKDTLRAEKSKEHLKEEKKSNTAPTTPSFNHTTVQENQQVTQIETIPKINKFYETLISFFKDGDRMILIVVCLFYALTKNQAIDSNILEVSGLYPFRLHKAKQLLQALTSEDVRNKKEEKKDKGGGGSGHGRSISLSGIDYFTHLSPSWADTHPLALLSEETIQKQGQDPLKMNSFGNKSDDSTSINIEDRTSQEQTLVNISEVQANIDNKVEKTQKKDDKWEYIARVTVDFGIPEEEAQLLWDKFMGPVFLTQHSIQEEKQTQLTKVQTKCTLVESGEDRVQNHTEQKIFDSPKMDQKNILNIVGDEENNVHKLGDFKLVKCLLTTLSQSNECRLITLQMITLLIKELVYSLDSPPNLSPPDFKLLEQAYFSSIENVRECLHGSLGDIFLELFERELKTYKQINFDGLIADTPSLLLPVSATPLSGFTLSKRLPSGQAEKIQKAIQIFLVLREFRYTMLKIKDDRLPLKEEPVLPMKPKDVYMFPTDENVTKNVIFSCSMAVGPTKKKVARFLSIEEGIVLLVEPDARSVPKSSKKDQTPLPTVSPPTTGHICNTIPLQNIEMEVDKSDDRVLQVISHPTTSQFSFFFDSSLDCQKAQHKLEKARNKVRANKMRQIEEMLKDDVS